MNVAHISHLSFSPDHEVTAMLSTDKIKYQFHELKKLDTIRSRKGIFFMRGDRYTPDEFFYGMDSTLNKYRPHSKESKHELVLGNPNRAWGSFNNGNSSTAEFIHIYDIAQPSPTELLIADGANGCIRHYSYESDLVSTLIGRCNPSWSSTDSLELGEKVSANKSVINFITTIVLVESKHLLLLADALENTIFRYHSDSEQISLLVKRDAFNHLTSILVNPEETIVYASYDYGISSVNLKSGIITPLIQGGNTNDVLTGMFSEAHPGDLDSLSWLIPGKVMMGLPFNNSGLVILDLETKHVSSFCAGRSLSSTTSNPTL